MRAPRHVLVGADRLQRALAVLPDEDAGAEGAQLRLLLVHAHAPAAAAQGDRRGQPGEACSGNFCMHRADLATLNHRARPPSTLIAVPVM